MSSDIVKRLRKAEVFETTTQPHLMGSVTSETTLGEIAADRIEALEAREFEHSKRAKELEVEISRLTTNGIHTCHDQCQRPLCSAYREIVSLQKSREAAEARAERLREALAEAKSMLAICQWDDDGPDAGYEAAWNKGLAEVNKALEDDKQ
jgi:hypothetical protein